ncbi:methyl-accepting chemotaxis protein [Treponema sp.]|uniref:methyl-accepting chemotaxis protein n=1 Tax=Treponema sp. TaxID=166 RepID=UPI00298E9409|nr:methyl-accepting chemotaxis protein [Treponema sp.]MCR5613404.1 methyl-accepting chemotaxis protein [Treponema sp.]
MRERVIKISLFTKFLSLLLAIIVSATFVIGIVSYNISARALKSSVERHLDILSKELADTIVSLNEHEFAFLEGLSKLEVICDENISIQEKHNVLKTVLKKMGPRYENIAYYDAQGNAVLSDGSVRNFKGAPYWEAAMRGERFISEPMFTTVTNSVLQNYCVPVFGKNNKPIGAIVLIINGNMILDTVKEIDMGGGIHPSVISRASGKTIANANPNTDENAQKEELDETKGLGLVLSHVFAGLDGQEDFTDPNMKVRMIVAYKPIPDTQWSIFAVAPYDFYYGSLKHMRLMIGVIIIVTVILSIIISALIVRVLVKPLIAVKGSIEEIASGNADLTKRINTTSTDEVGDVVKGFNGFVGKLQEIVQNLLLSKDNLIQVDSDLQLSTQEASSSIIQIISNIESVKNQIVTQSDSVTETAGAVNEISANIESLEKMISHQSQNVEQASSAVEEMIGNINSVNTSVTKMIESFNELERNSNSGIATQANANERILQIEEQSKMLQDANSAISAIAEQTNLLAMNAAIEAAHAGEAGKGFSVVADEIRKLSETSTAQSKTIGAELTKIQDTIKSVVEVSSETNRTFASVAQSINATSQIISQIKSAMEEQQTGSKQIIDALASMNESTVQVKSASEEMTEGNKHILAEVAKLKEATETITGSVQEMHNGATRINETGSELRTISTKVTDSIRQIGDEIGLFKV